MALLAKPADQLAERRPKIVVYGPPGGGKTTFAASWPKPYFIDVEGGAVTPRFLELIRQSGGARMGPEEGSRDLRTVAAQVRELRTAKHDFQTLVIDSESKLMKLAYAEEAKKTGEDFARNRREPNKVVMSLLDQAIVLDMNVIIIGHEKTKYEAQQAPNGKTETVQTGVMHDGYKDLIYEMDYALETRRTGKHFRAYVFKSRDPRIPQSETIEFSYDAIVERLGTSAIERDAVPVELADAALASQVLSAIDATRWPEKVVVDGRNVGWAQLLKQYRADDWDDVPAESVRKFIDYITTTDLETIN